MFRASCPLSFSLIADFSFLEEYVHLFLSPMDFDTVEIPRCPLQTVKTDSIHLTPMVSEFM